MSPQLLPFIQTITAEICPKKVRWGKNPSIIYLFLSCQEDSEDGELGRRSTEELFLEAEPSTEDGEPYIQHDARPAGSRVGPRKLLLSLVSREPVELRHPD